MFTQPNHVLAHIHRSRRLRQGQDGGAIAWIACGVVNELVCIGIRHAAIVKLHFPLCGGATHARSAWRGRVASAVDGSVFNSREDCKAYRRFLSTLTWVT